MPFEELLPKFAVKPMADREHEIFRPRPPGAFERPQRSGFAWRVWEPWVRRALNGRKRRFPARAVSHCQTSGQDQTGKINSLLEARGLQPWCATRPEHLQCT
jgi:hypothetical protein